MNLMNKEVGNNPVGPKGSLRRFIVRFLVEKSLSDGRIVSAETREEGIRSARNGRWKVPNNKPRSS